MEGGVRATERNTTKVNREAYQSCVVNHNVWPCIICWVKPLTLTFALCFGLGLVLFCVPAFPVDACLPLCHVFVSTWSSQLSPPSSISFLHPLPICASPGIILLTTSCRLSYVVVRLHIRGERQRRTRLCWLYDRPNWIIFLNNVSCTW